MKLSVIDQSPVPAGFTPADALRNTIELARLADRLGYERYWIAEHHAIARFGQSRARRFSITRVAAETSGIRVGSGGVMLPHYSSLKVAETFQDAARAVSGAHRSWDRPRARRNPLETFALTPRPQPASGSRRLPAAAAELLAFLDRSFPSHHPFSRISLSPAMPGAPDVWLLGSSMWSASAAAQLGLPYAFAHFIDQHPTRIGDGVLSRISRRPSI